MQNERIIAALQQEREQAEAEKDRLLQVRGCCCPGCAVAVLAPTLLSAYAEELDETAGPFAIYVLLCLASACATLEFQTPKAAAKATATRTEHRPLRSCPLLLAVLPGAGAASAPGSRAAAQAVPPAEAGGDAGDLFIRILM